MEKILTR